MTMRPFVRKLALMAHIVASIGWIGAAPTYLVLAITALRSRDPHFLAASFPVMRLAVRYAIIPMSLASLGTGLLMSLGTTWGLFRHYWIIFKLLLNVFAITILLLYTQSLASFAKIAEKPILSNADLRSLRSPMHVVHTTGGLVVLLIATGLSVYKPRGQTAYGVRKQREDLEKRAEG